MEVLTMKTIEAFIIGLGVTAGQYAFAWILRKYLESKPIKLE